MKKVYGRAIQQRPSRPRTSWERVCDNLGVDPVVGDPKTLKILGPNGYTGHIETTCQRCGLEMEGQFRRCIKCGGDWP